MWDNYVLFIIHMEKQVMNFHIAMETVLDGSCLQQKGESDCEAHCLIFLHMTRAISYA